MQPDDGQQSVDCECEVTSVLDADDERWTREVNSLMTGLRGAARRTVQAQEGTKGGAESIILALGTANVIKALADVIKAWLDRNAAKQVKMTLSRKKGKEEEQIEVLLSGQDKDEVEAALARLRRF